MGRHDSVLAYLHIVGYLYEIIQFHSLADDGAAHGGAVDTGVGTYFYVVLNSDNTNLGNLVVTFGIGGKTEAIGADDAACMDCNIITELTTLIDGDVGIDGTAFA